LGDNESSKSEELWYQNKGYGPKLQVSKSELKKKKNYLFSGRGKKKTANGDYTARLKLGVSHRFLAWKEKKGKARREKKS